MGSNLFAVPTGGASSVREIDGDAAVAGRAPRLDAVERPDLNALGERRGPCSTSWPPLVQCQLGSLMSDEDGEGEAVIDVDLDGTAQVFVDVWQMLLNP